MSSPEVDLSLLLNDISTGNCVPFLGPAGDVATLSPRTLAGRLCSDIGYTGPPLALMDAAQRYELKCGRNALRRNIRDWLTDPALQPSAVHRFFAQLPLRFYLTTAQHDLLERALRDAGHNAQPIVSQIDAAYMDVSRTIVVKLLGDAQRPESLRLTEQDYQEFIESSPLLADIIRATLATRTLLFADYDLSDAPLRNLFFQIARLQGVHKRSAYAVWPTFDEEQRQYWGQQNLHLIVSEPLPFLERLHRELSRLHPVEKPGQAPLPALPERPFRFLDSYTAGDAALYAGREQETMLLSQKILAHRLVVLTGASGAGKTSLLQAGVGPRLAVEGWRLIVVRLLGDPLQSLCHALAPLAQAVDSPLAAKAQADTLSLRDLVLAAEMATDKRLVIVLDQFEELFLRTGGDAQRSLMAGLAPCLVDPEIDARFVISLRDDFFLQLGQFAPLLPSIFHNVFVLNRLRREQAIAAIVDPLRRLQIDFEAGLAERIAADLDKDGVDPPQLQIICDRLYDDMLARGGRRVTTEDYTRLGGVEQLLQAYLGEVLRLLPEARPVLEALVGDQGLKAVRSLADIRRRTGTDGTLASILERLVQARLVRALPQAQPAEGADTAGGDEAAARYELVHDVLAAAVAKWLSESTREAERARGMLERGLSDWHTSQVLFDRQRLDFVAARWAFLPAVEEEVQAFLLRSVVCLGHDIPRWLERIPAVEIQRSVLMDLAAAPVPAIRTCAMTELARLPAAEQDDRFLALLRQAAISDPAPAVRQAATQALHRLLGAAAVAFLAKQAALSDRAVRTCATEDLVLLSDTEVPLSSILGGTLRVRIASGLARLRLARHWPAWGWRTAGAAAGGAIGLGLGFAVQLYQDPATMFVVAAYMMVFGALAGLGTGLGIAVAAALANRDRLLPRAIGGLVGAGLGCAIGLQGAQAAINLPSKIAFWHLGLLAGLVTGAGLGLSLWNRTLPGFQVIGGAVSGAFGFVLANMVFGAGWSPILALLTGTLFGGLVGTGLTWADARSAQDDAAS